MKEKRQFKQIVPLTTDAVYFLESPTRSLQEDHVKVILGHFYASIPARLVGNYTGV